MIIGGPIICQKNHKIWSILQPKKHDRLLMDIFQQSQFFYE